MQESFGLNCDWLLLSSLFSFKNAKILSEISVLNILEDIRRNDTGR